MTILISAHNSEGVVGRCDANCYDAQAIGCDCICGGMNHGAGLEQARAQTSAIAADALETWAAARGIDPATLNLRAQAELFPFGNEPTTEDIRRNLRRAQAEQKAARSVSVSATLPDGTPIESWRTDENGKHTHTRKGRRWKS